MVWFEITQDLVGEWGREPGEEERGKKVRTLLAMRRRFLGTNTPLGVRECDQPDFYSRAGMPAHALRKN